MPAVEAVYAGEWLIGVELHGTDLLTYYNRNSTRSTTSGARTVTRNRVYISWGSVLYEGVDRRRCSLAIS